MMLPQEPQHCENPFQIEDLLVFDDPTMQHIFTCDGFNLNIKDVARSLKGAPEALVTRVKRNMRPGKRAQLIEELCRPASSGEIEAARRRVLDELFWELTYWKTPELYEALTEGEPLHPGIFRQLEPDLSGKTALDAGAGCGRATFECVRHGARQVYAVEPSPGLLRILKHKLVNLPDAGRIVPLQGRFDHIPLEAKSVDIALSCAAFTAEPVQGGDPGLAELRRVTRRGGKIVLIWPRPVDHDWLVSRGFRYVTLPLEEEMRVHFRSVEIALLCARRFYAYNDALIDYIQQYQQQDIPFSVLGIMNPPHEYCWLPVR
jgi:ubiquinone/menaquinone biosynthesis C-methylase UbiE